MSESFASTIPGEIPPMSVEEESRIVTAIYTELNKKFCVDLANPPTFDRITSPSFTAHSTGRTVFIGGSNMGKIARAAAENGNMEVDLTIGGWTPKSGKIEGLAEKISKLGLGDQDQFVIDPMVNTAFLGTNKDGLPILPTKSDEDGWYHLIGNLQPSPMSTFKNSIKTVEKITETAAGTKTRLTQPPASLCQVLLLHGRRPCGQPQRE